MVQDTRLRLAHVRAVEFFALLVNTLLLRPYVFVFLAAFLWIGSRLLGWPRTAAFFFPTWITAFLCEFSSTRTGIPFGWYHYTGSTKGQELYIANVPFMDSLSFAFLLFASYCVALAFLLPGVPGRSGRRWPPPFVLDPAVRRSWPVLSLTVLLFALIDVVIDPVALRGEEWFLGRIYYYPEPGVHFGVPIANYLGWAVVGLISLSAYFFCDRRLSPSSMPSGNLIPRETASHAGPAASRWILLGCGLYYGVLIFNLAVTFAIGETLIGVTGVLMYLPITVLLTFRILGYPPLSGSTKAMPE